MKRRNVIKFGLAGSLAGLVPTVGFSQECDPTTADIEGPFYTPNAPQRTNLLPKGAKGERLFLTGTVYAMDCKSPLPSVELDVWQADDGGAYDNVGFDYRGKFNTDELGNYSMETILPGKYLNGAQFRPRHIHFKVRYQGEVLTTQLYFEGDDSIPIDPWASDPSAEGRIIPLVPDQQDILHGVFDIYLDVEATSSTFDRLAQKSNRIASVSPNPLTDHGSIIIVQGSPADLALQLRDLRGTLVREIEIPSQSDSEITVPFDNKGRNGLKLAPGIYILQLEVDGRLWDAKRIVII